MMGNNKVFLMGRATEEYTLRQFQGGVSYVDFTLAVDNKMATKENNRPKAFFFNVRVIGKTAEYLVKYGAPKGQILVVGYLESGKYENSVSHQMVYYTRINAEEITIIDYKKKEKEKGADNPFDGYAFVPSGEDTELPFN